ncbi:MAG: hypothetical protein RL237_402, partial [Actinomycetota bacterium]
APSNMAASLNLSKVESRSAPHLLTPLVDWRATAPSNKSNKTNMQTKTTPIKNSPFGKK